jgi:hypothetical protein
MTSSVARVPYGGTSALEAYQSARIAQTWAEESATLGYATEEANYRNGTYIGEGEARLQLVPFISKWKRDSAQQEADWRESCAAEARALPQTCLGAPDLEAVTALSDPMERAAALGDMLGQIQALVNVVSLHRLDAMRAMIDAGMTAADVARALGITPQAVSKQLSKDARA